MSNEHDGKGKKFLAHYLGTVTDNADPKKLGRVRLSVEGVVQNSDWALPAGNPGGGSSRHGLFSPPEKGASVFVFFLQGDVDKPAFMVGHWGAPGGKIETPGPVGGYATPKIDLTPGTPEEISPEDASKVTAFETAKWVVVLDDRDGKEVAKIEHKKTGDHILLDGSKQRMDINSTANIWIRCMGSITIDCNGFTVNGRPIFPNGKAVM